MKTESDEQKDGISVPLNFKTYTIQDRRIVTQPPKRSKLNKPRESYDGPKDAKKIDLARPGEDPKPVYIAMDLLPEEEELLVKTLSEYRDVFAWSYKDLKGVDPNICKHTIPMHEDAKPRKLCPYTYSDTFSRKIKEEIYKLLDAKFFYEIEHME